jgi:hypothetical protein
MYVVSSAEMKVPVEDSRCLDYAMFTGTSVTSISNDANNTVA